MFFNDHKLTAINIQDAYMQLRNMQLIESSDLSQDEKAEIAKKKLNRMNTGELKQYIGKLKARRDAKLKAGQESAKKSLASKSQDRQSSSTAERSSMSAANLKTALDDAQDVLKDKMEN